MTYNSSMNIRFCYLIFLIALFLILAPEVSANTGIFRTLRIGDTGEDVKLLQSILNSFEDTQVSVTGPGSLGQETTYFGVLTKEAVMRFQKKYSPEVLFPAGVALPTGIVGEFTRKKLNSSQLASIQISPKSNNEAVSLLEVSTTVSAPPSAVEIFYLFSKPKLGYLSTYQALPGSQIVVHGIAFQKTGNSVCFNDVCVEGLESNDGTSLAVTLPKSLKTGSYNVYVKTKNGSTYDASYGNYFTVTSTPGILPKITRIFPEVISIHSTDPITIYGEFEATNNQIITSFGSVKDKNSTNGQITFLLNEIKIPADIKSSPTGKEVRFPLHLYVKTAAGISPEPSMVYISY
jgi:peptidoglycan hydrolase-like protein with peptidoglycan-binding domain